MTSKPLHLEILPVVHAVPGAWLPKTQTWLYDQIRFVPDAIEPHIVCDRTANLDQFAVPRVHAVDGTSRTSRRIDRMLRLTRLRCHRGLLARIVAATGTRVLHSHFGPEGCRNRTLGRRPGVRHVVTFYGYDVNCLPRHARWRRRYDRLFRDVDLVLCEGSHMADCLRALGCPDEKVRVQHLGIDLARIPYRPRTWDGREPLRVLLAAAFREKKGLPLAIEALSRLRHDVDLAITIIGDATAAPGSAAERARIEATIDRHALRDCVTQLGFQSHDVLTATAETHHLFVAPSLTASDGDTEGGAPVALIEMAASGMPIVSTRHCDIPGVVRHATSGFLASENDVDDLLVQLRTMISHVPCWPSMLAAGRRWTEINFDARRQGERLAEIYANLATGAPLMWSGTHVEMRAARTTTTGTTTRTIPATRRRAA